MVLDRLRDAVDVSRSNCFVGVLHSRFLVPIDVGRLRQVRLFVVPRYELACGFQRSRCDAHGIGAHVGYQTDRALWTDVNPLVQLLRNPHSSCRREAEPFGGLLL